MSGKPSSEGATRVITLVQEILDLQSEETILAAQAHKLGKVRETLTTRSRELQQLLRDMDVSSSGNHDWERRAAWLVVELVRQLKPAVPNAKKE